MEPPAGAWSPASGSGLPPSTVVAASRLPEQLKEGSGSSWLDCPEVVHCGGTADSRSRMLIDLRSGGVGIGDGVLQTHGASLRPRSVDLGVGELPSGGISWMLGLPPA